MLKRILVALLALCALGAPAYADPVDDYVRNQMQLLHIPGMAVAVVKDGKIAKLSTYGQANVQHNRPVTADTAFQIASATKMFTGMAILKLAHDGRLSLDDNLRAHFPEAPESWDRITIRQLATHSSGLEDRLEIEGEATVAKIVEVAQRTPFSYESGSQSRYGFTDFVVMQAIVEKVMGKPFPAALRQLVIEPLGLTNTGFETEFLANGRPPYAERADIYEWKNGVNMDDHFIYGPQGYAAGGLLTSIRDFATFAVFFDQPEGLTDQEVATLWTAPTLSTGKAGEYGIGWTVRTYHGFEAVGHSGGPSLSDMVRFPEQKLTIIILSNQRRLFPTMAESIADFYIPKGTLKPAIADHRPDITKRLHTALIEAAVNRIDTSRFSEQTANESKYFFGDFGGALMEAVGPLNSVELVAETISEGRIERRYRVNFERKTMHWLIGVNKDGLVDRFQPWGE